MINPEINKVDEDPQDTPNVPEVVEQIDAPKENLPVSEDQDSPADLVPPKKTVTLNIGTRKNGEGFGVPVSVVKEPEQLEIDEQPKESVQQQESVQSKNFEEPEELLGSREESASRLLEAYKKGNWDDLDETLQAQLDEALKSLNGVKKDAGPAEDIIGKIIEGQTKEIEKSIAQEKSEKWTTADDKIVEYITALVFNAKEGERNKEEFLKDKRIPTFKNYLQIVGRVGDGDGVEELRKQIEEVEEKTVLEGSLNAEPIFGATTKSTERREGESAVKYLARTARENLGVDEKDDSVLQSQMEKEKSDLEFAREHLKKMYGSGAEIIVDENVPSAEISMQAPKNPVVQEYPFKAFSSDAIQEPVSEETKFVETPLAVQEQQKADVIQEPVSEEKSVEASPIVAEQPKIVEDFWQKKEKALETLSDPKVMERSPKEIVESFRNLTEKENGEHRHLAKEKNEMAYGRLKKSGMRVIVGKEAIEKVRQEIIVKEQQRIKNTEHSRASIAFWERNYNVKPKDREKYLTDIKNKLGITGPDGDIALDRLINDGYLVEKAKSRWFLKGVKIPKANGKSFSFDEEFLQEIAKEAKANILINAQDNAELKIKQGKKRVFSTKQLCASEIIRNTVADYKSQQVETKEPEETQIQSVGEPEKLNEDENKAPIGGVSSFAQLYKTLESAGGVKGGKRSYSADELKENIEAIRNTLRGLIKNGVVKDAEDFVKNSPLLSLITKSDGLRQKVKDLLVDIKGGKEKKKTAKKNKLPAKRASKKRK
jgi:hypothetical protein